MILKNLSEALDRFAKDSRTNLQTMVISVLKHSPVPVNNQFKEDLGTITASYDSLLRTVMILYIEEVMAYMSKHHIVFGKMLENIQGQDDEDTRRINNILKEVITIITGKADIQDAKLNGENFLDILTDQRQGEIAAAFKMCQKFIKLGEQAEKTGSVKQEIDLTKLQDVERPVLRATADFCEKIIELVKHIENDKKAD